MRLAFLAPEIVEATPHTGYGWLEPGPALSAGQCEVLQVRRFWEKPSREVARELRAQGCLWNSFIIVGRLSTLLGLFIVAMFELYLSFYKIRTILGVPMDNSDSKVG